MSVQEAEAYLKALEQESVDLADREVEIRLEQARSSSPAPDAEMHALLRAMAAAYDGDLIREDAEVDDLFDAGLLSLARDITGEATTILTDKGRDAIRAAVASSPVPDCPECGDPASKHDEHGCSLINCGCGVASDELAAPVSVGDEDEPMDRCDCNIPYLEGAGQHSPGCSVFKTDGGG